ncbi:helix-turn-helix domain-containing protein [Microbacterium sp. Au-Mic1]|uniref:winged helix-turn-helix domain-containing protein n=1 Tax=Microbacterium sp. Au-Mic1 TaxID=2906457 RepID=UPI001E2AD2B4|nr:helix-turn-helix domain-containing protein [Microbacterium sp. Au-Mic1]MCE4024597.1 helix-turn-helix domain-containing protein [Microbacterium sp. Au-Mic1]
MLAEELTTAQLRVLSHPVRLAFLRRLRDHGPATSRALGREFELDSGAASYHLRRLEAGRLIREDPELGTRRERWWRAVDDMSQFDPSVHDDDAAARQYVQSVVLSAAEELHRVAAAVPDADRTWLSEAAFVDLRLPLDGPGRRALLAELMTVVDRYRDAGDPATAPATQVNLQIYAQR